MKANPQPKKCVCVLGEGEGADLDEFVADRQATMQFAVTKSQWSQWHDQ